MRKSKYAGATVLDLTRMRELEAENARLNYGPRHRGTMEPTLLIRLHLINWALVTSFITCLNKWRALSTPCS